MCTLVLGTRLLLQKHWGFSQQIFLQLILKRFVRCLGKKCLLLKDGQQSHRFLHELDSGLEVHAEVHHLPLDALPDVLLLLQHKHVVVEELLQLLVTEVDTDLLESVELEDLETSDVQHTDEVYFLHGGIDQGSVAEINKPQEQSKTLNVMMCIENILILAILKRLTCCT